jgi:hypothetical protein
VDFSEARDLFVNIFQISDRTGKIVDRGLILENPRGLSQNRQNLDRGLISQKSRDLFARFPKYPGIRNYFLTDISWTGSTSPWTGWACSVHRGRRRRGQRARRRAHRSSASGRSGAPNSPAGAQNGGGHGELV